MTDWFYLLTLTVLIGCCDAFGSPEVHTSLEYPENGISFLQTSNLPRKKLANPVQILELSKRCFPDSNLIFQTDYLSENGIDGYENEYVRSNTNWPISRRMKKDKIYWYRDLKSKDKNDLGSTTANDYNFNNRRLFWEPIMDGNIIASIGSLFSENIKKEADRERIQREKIREDKLLKKYLEMLNDPEKYAELERESANSPSRIDQIIRRSFFQKFDDNIDKKNQRKSSPWHWFNPEELKSARKINQPENESAIFFKIFEERNERKTSDHLSQNEPMSFLRHQPLVTSDKRRKNVDYNDRSAISRVSLKSSFNDVDKKCWNSPTDIKNNVIVSINSFPILILFNRGYDLRLYTPSKMFDEKIRGENSPSKYRCINVY